MGRRSSTYRVTVVAPGPNDGPNLYLRISPPKGEGRVRRKSSGTTDRARAEALAAAEELARNAELAEGPTIVEVFRRFVAQREDGRTHDLHANTLRVLEPYLGDVRPGGAGITFVDDLRTQLLEADPPYRASSVRTFLANLRACWNWARSEGLITDQWPTPARVLRGRKRGELRTGKRAYMPHELALVLSEPTWCHGLLVFLSETGCRESEARALNVGDLRRDGSGAWWAHVADAKSGRARLVPVLEGTAELVLGGRVELGAPLFVSPAGERCSPQAVRKVLARILDRHGLRRVVAETARRSWDVDVHSLRRSVITHCELAGVARSTRMEITGHESFGVHDGYTRNYPGRHLHAAIEQMQAWRAEQLARRATVQSHCENRPGAWYNPGVGNGVATGCRSKAGAQVPAPQRPLGPPYRHQVASPLDALELLLGALGVSPE